VVNALQTDFIRSGMRVLDQRSLQGILAQHQLNYGGFVSPQIAMQMGKFLGPTAMLIIDVSKATTERESSTTSSKDNKNVVHNTYHSKTKAGLRVSVQAIDLTTGQTFQPAIFDKNTEKENVVNEKCCAEFPSDFEVFGTVLQQVVADAHRLMLVWSEPQELIFFDDKDCRMNVASDLVKSGDLQGAGRQSTENLDACKSTPNIDDKKLAHAWYNVGMVAFLEGRFNNAQFFFDQAQKVKDIGITTDAITQLKRAKQAADDLKAFEARLRAATGAGANGADAAMSSAPGRDSAAPKASPVERLKALDAAYKAGLLTKEEYDKKKAEILRDM